MSPPRSLDAARVHGLPSTAYYVPDFISSDEERHILARIASAPKPSWKQLTHRRLQSWPFPLLNDKLLDAPLPSWLEDPVVPRLLSLSVSKTDERHLFSQSPHARPNHVLINEYPPGVGIMAHKTAPPTGLYNDGGALDPTPAWRILQEPRSLLITTESLYMDYLHGIAGVAEDVQLSAESIVNWPLLGNPDAYAVGSNVRGLRTSLTYRDVVKVSRAGSKLGLNLVSKGASAK
ncbi:hypothetical protein XA68_15020 [Ophiocordyceps unilateralis]|uniref:Fe2OG dioxygenase domain-containing protein n=1 Tax=Ophiocordyceps unilateralis TaxID=268505 RepID=A0A2A9P990_OPHUN|nr:hypothetical protein XA68_15020 [Ophiocordyceps unilateralis]